MLEPGAVLVELLKRAANPVVRSDLFVGFDSLQDVRQAQIEGQMGIRQWVVVVVDAVVVGVSEIKFHSCFVDIFLRRKEAR